MTFNHPLSALRHHVTGAIERGEAQPIAEMPKPLDLTAHTRKVLMLSTGHITQHTAEVLTACAQARKGTMWAAIAFENWGEYGWLMYAHDDVIDDEIARSHPELLAIFVFARKHDFGYVWLDCDWETLPPESGLPVFEWWPFNLKGPT